MSEVYWFNGQPFAAFNPDAPAPVTPNTELYWVSGAASGDLLLLADTIPYVPPYVPPAPSPSPYGAELYWFNGEPSRGLVDDPDTRATGQLLYWVNGDSYGNLYQTTFNPPYVPPYVPPAPSPSPWGSELYWVSGEPANGLVDDPDTRATGQLLYWLEGDSDADIFPTTFNPPYVPPYNPPQAFSSFYGNETFWFSGMPSEGIKTTALMTTNSESYYEAGASEHYLFKIDNSTTGKMFLLFE